MDRELRALMTITRSLPRWRGAGRLVALIRRLYLRSPRGAAEVDVRGSLMRLRPEQFVDGWLLFGPRFYEDTELRYVEAALADGDTFIDVGAYLGLYALVAARRVGRQGCVLAIEADPQNAADLRHNLTLNPEVSIQLLEDCVSDRVETRRLGARATTNRSSASLLVETADAVTVTCRPLLDLIREHGIVRIDGVKLDIEGAEHSVLERFFADAPETMWPRFLLTEFYESLVGAAGGNVLDLLASRGYTCRARHETNYIFERLPSSSR